jgi:hypothetical protein
LTTVAYVVCNVSVGPLTATAVTEHFLGDGTGGEKERAEEDGGGLHSGGWVVVSVSVGRCVCSCV